MIVERKPHRYVAATPLYTPNQLRMSQISAPRKSSIVEEVEWPPKPKLPIKRTFKDVSIQADKESSQSEFENPVCVKQFIKWLKPDSFSDKTKFIKESSPHRNLFREPKSILAEFYCNKKDVEGWFCIVMIKKQDKFIFYP